MEHSIKKPTFLQGFLEQATLGLLVEMRVAGLRPAPPPGRFYMAQAKLGLSMERVHTVGCLPRKMRKQGMH